MTDLKRLHARMDEMEKRLLDLEAYARRRGEPQDETIKFTKEWCAAAIEKTEPEQPPPEPPERPAKTSAENSASQSETGPAKEAPEKAPDGRFEMRRQVWAGLASEPPKQVHDSTEIVSVVSLVKERDALREERDALKRQVEVRYTKADEEIKALRERVTWLESEVTDCETASHMKKSAERIAELEAALATAKAEFEANFGGVGPCDDCGKPAGIRICTGEWEKRFEAGRQAGLEEAARAADEEARLYAESRKQSLSIGDDHGVVTCRSVTAEIRRLLSTPGERLYTLAEVEAALVQMGASDELWGLHAFRAALTGQVKP